MFLISSFIMNELVISYSLLFYQRIGSVKLKKHTFGLAALFGIYMIWTRDLMINPWRLILGLAAIFVLVQFLERKVLWSALVAAFLYGYFLLMLSNFVIATITFFIGIGPDSGLFYVSLTLGEIGIYTFAYYKSKFIENLSSFEERASRGLLITIASLIIISYGGLLSFYENVEQLVTPLYSIIFWFLIFLFFVAVVLFIILVRYVTKKQKELSETEDGDFIFSVQDHALEFPLSILSKLGERGISTNATGDGYAEIFQSLKRTGASLWIKEGRDKKKISVVFNELQGMYIESTYRKKELEVALIDSVIEVV